MKLEVKVPSVGESVTKGILSTWLVAEGAVVEEGTDLFELETDKATVTVPSPGSGALAIAVPAGTEVEIGSLVAHIDTDVTAPAPVAAAPRGDEAPKGDAAAKAAAPKGGPAPEAPLSPSVRRIVAESGLSPAAVTPTGPRGRITKGDALRAVAEQRAGAAVAQPAAPARSPGAAPRRQPLSTIRKRIAEKLVEAQRNTAYLTTFNEVDMHEVMELRVRYREEFERLHGIKLGIMSFFVRACCIALAEVPEVNAMIDGDEIVYHPSCDIGVAVSTERGLLVPVVRGAEAMGLAALERAIADLAARARERTIMPDELAGGTFSITNGGVFGSLMSTPLPNYPQAAILGMHAIQKRPVAIDDQVVVRPMMYVALTYDHRLIDGKDAVGFLKRVKELVEDPVRQLLEA